MARATSADEGSDPTPKSDGVRVSVLVLVTYDPEPLSELYSDVAAALRDRTDDFEFVFLVEPGFDDWTAGLSELAEQGEPIRVFQVGQPMGETALLRLGLREATGSVIVTTPAYRQVESDAVVRLVEAVENGSDLAIARRWPRKDSWFNRLHTQIFRALAVRVGGTRIEINDLGCGVRAMRRELVEQIPLYGDLGVFLPLMAARDGFTVQEVAAPQHEADLRTRVHSPFAYLRRFFDLLGLFFLLRFTEKPLRFFGAVGAAGVIPGALILGIVFVQRLAGQGIANRPLLLLGVLLVVLGIQAIALGLIGEIIVHLHATRQRSYRIRGSGDD